MTGGFGQLLRAEWTKFRTVPGWVVALLAGAALIVGLGLGPSMTGSCGQHGTDSECVPILGPDGREVSDTFYFVHQSLTGDGSITVRVSSLTGLLPGRPSGGNPADDRPYEHLRAGVAPWSKAGLILKDGTRPGSTYAAMMVTGEHGTRMQYGYTHDIAGPAGTVGWLRLTRTGDTVTGAESGDGTHWTTVGTAHLAGLPSTVQVGLFATSPQYAETVSASFILTGDASGPTRATATFDHLDGQGTWHGPSPTWTGDQIGGAVNMPPFQRGEFHQNGDAFTVSGSGDIAPSVSGAAGVGTTVTQTLVGTFIGLILVIVVGAMFITAEYRRGLIRTTLAASPRRGRILAAKAIVIGTVTYVVGLVAAAVVVTLGQGVLRANGVYVQAAPALTELRLIAGTAALLAVAAVLAVALGALLRRSAVAVTTVIVVIVLPYLLAISVLPLGAAQWLLRITPAAAFAIQQSAVRYPQVDNIYSPVDGYFPLAPWTGFGVLCAWTVLALAAATIQFRRRDA